MNLAPWSNFGDSLVRALSDDNTNIVVQVYELYTSSNGEEYSTYHIAFYSPIAFLTKATYSWYEDQESAKKAADKLLNSLSKLQAFL